MNIEHTYIFIITLICGLLLTLLPAVAMWRSVSRQASGRVAWFQHALALFGPFIATFVISVLVFLPDYSGRCGGWLGETTPCSFGQYATETMQWMAFSMGIPALIGMLLGVVVLIVGLIKHARSCPTS